MQKQIQKITAKVVLFSIFLSQIIPVKAYWTDINSTIVLPNIVEPYVQCPNDHLVSDDELAQILGISIGELQAMKAARSLTNDDICTLPKARVTRALKKTKDSSKPSPGQLLAWQLSRVSSDGSGTINEENADAINLERQALVVADGPMTGGVQAPVPQGTGGTIDKTKWFSLGPSNISGRIISILIDPDAPASLFAGSAGGGLWKSSDHGHSWSPVADFPGNTAVSVIAMDPDNHDVMYIGTGDRAGPGNAVPGSGIFKSTDRGVTWVHISSTDISQSNTWKQITGFYDDPTSTGRYIVTSAWGQVQLTEDGMQTWNPVLSGSTISASTIKANPYISGSVIMPSFGGVMYASIDYGHSFATTMTPMVDRTEIAFSRPNMFALSGSSTVSGEMRIVQVQNTKPNVAYIDEIRLYVNSLNQSGTVCLRPQGSSLGCNAYSGSQLYTGTGVYVFPIEGNTNLFISGSNNSIAGSGIISFEAYFDNGGAPLTDAVNMKIDSILYRGGADTTEQSDIYINGQSFANGLVYASSAADNGKLYRSPDLGMSWELVSSGANILGNQGWYSHGLWANPVDPRHIIIGGIDLYESRDGGYTWRRISDWVAQMYGGYVTPHADQHVIVSDPRFDDKNNKTIYFGTDGGVYRSSDIDTVTDPLLGWENISQGLNVTQLYSISGTGNIVQGGSQDNGVNFYRGTSQQNWQMWIGGDGMDTAVDPRGRYMYGEFQMGAGLSRFAIQGTGNIASIGNFAGTKGDCTWMTPFLLDPSNPSRMLYGCKSLWISDNVDTVDASQVLFRDVGNPDPTNPNFISHIAIAKQDSGRIWVSKGNTIYMTMSGTIVSGEVGGWRKITNSNLPGRTITAVEIDYYNPNKVYIAYGGYEPSNLWVTEDNGVTWMDISNNIPKAPIYSLKQFRNNPKYLYAGTEVGLFTSEDGGLTWSTTNEGPANTPVYDIEWYNDNTLLIATFGRGAWALDLNNLTIVPPPTVSVSSGTVIHTMSGVQDITHYRDPIQLKISGNQTIFYTIDGSVPTATSSGMIDGITLTLSGNTALGYGMQKSFSGDILTVKLRSRDYANNWSDVSTYVYHWKKSVSPLSQITFDQGVTTLTNSNTTSFITTTTPTESGSMVDLMVRGSTLSGGSVIYTDTTDTGALLNLRGSVDQYGTIKIESVDMGRFSDGPIEVQWKLIDLFGTSATGVLSLSKNTNTLGLKVESIAKQGSGYIQSGSVWYTENAKLDLNISTSELSQVVISSSGMNDQQFWNMSKESSTGRYNTGYTLALSGSDRAIGFIVRATDLGGNTDGGILSGTVIYDRTIPINTIVGTSSGMKIPIGYYRLQGFIEDISPVTITINGVSALMDGKNWSLDIGVQMGTNTYTITTTDILGHRTTQVLSLEGYQLSVTGPGGGGSLSFVPVQASIITDPNTNSLMLMSIVPTQILSISATPKSIYTLLDTTGIASFTDALNKTLSATENNIKKLFFYDRTIVAIDTLIRQKRNKDIIRYKQVILRDRQSIVNEIIKKYLSK